MRNYIMATAAAAALALTGCSTTPETDSGYHDWPTPSTIEEGPVPGSAADFKRVGDRVFFDLNKYNIKPEGMAVVQAQSDWLKNWPSVGVVVEGHADERGTVEYNLALGERRATSLSKALMAHGIDKSRIEVVSYGKEHPEATGHDEASWAKNRRAVTTIR